MRIFSLLFIFISSVVIGQENPKPFGSEILTYHPMGHTIYKRPDMVILDSKGVKIEDRDSCYQILKDGYNEHYITMAYVLNGDTVFPQRYNYKFIYLPIPKVRWLALEKYGVRGTCSDQMILVLHKDSLAYFKDFEIHHFVPNVPEEKWEVVKGEIITRGLHQSFPFDGGNSIPDAFIDSLKALEEDTLFVTMQLAVRGEDSVVRKKSESIMLVKLDGLAYELHRNPYYFFNLYSDTVEITKEQLFSADSLVIDNKGRIYLKLPRLKKDYYYKWYSEYGFCYDAPYTKVEAGKGFVIINAGGDDREELLQLTYVERRSYPKKYDPQTGQEMDLHFNKKKIFFTYPKP